MDRALRKAAVDVDRRFGGASPEIWTVLLGAATSEVAKGLVLVLIFVFATGFDNPTDGIVYGAAVGLGFASTQNILHDSGVAGGVFEMGPPMPVIARMLSVAVVHAAAGIAIGGCGGLASLSRRPGSRTAWMISGIAAATLIHGGWLLLGERLRGTASGAYLWMLLLSALGIVLGVLVVWVFHCEHRILDRQLKKEVDLGTVPSWVIEIIPFYRRRIRSSWWPNRSERTVLARLLARLAFRTHAVDRLPEEEARLAGLEVVQLRNRIRRMLEPMSAQEGN